MAKFQVGDKVRCIAPLYDGESTADILTVATPKEGSGPGYFRVRELLRLLPYHVFDEARYELAHRCDAAPIAAPTARKDDSGKLDMNLLDDMPRALKAVVEVMQWAITDKKPVPYVRGSWLSVHADRYRAAIKRHERSAAEQATAPNAHAARFQRDDETQLLHLAHTACSAMMALENTLREMEASK